MSKVTHGLSITTIGLAIGLVPTLLYMALADQGIGPLLSTELAPQLPLYLFLSLLSVPITLSGLMLFRRGVREQYQLGYTTLRSEPSGLRASPPPAYSGIKSSESAETIPLRNGPLETARSMTSSRIIVRSMGGPLVCGNCGSEAPIGSTNCPSCGARFPLSDDKSRSCPVCGAGMERLTPLDDRVFVCGLCFSELELPPEMSNHALHAEG